MTERHAPLVRRRELAPCVRAALGAATLATAGGLNAAGLFLPVGAADDTADIAPPAKSASAAGRVGRFPVPNAPAQLVRIDRRELTAVRDDVESAGAGRMLLNIKDGVRFDMVVEQTTATKWGHTLSGRVAGEGGGFVTLVVHEEAVAGSIWTPGAAYELSYLGGDVHTLRDVTNAPPPICGGASPPASSTLDAYAPQGAGEHNARNRAIATAVADDSVVDILILWTSAREELVGGESSIRSLIDLAIAYTNDAFERSGAFVRLRLLHAERTDYAEEDAFAALAALADPTDGQMDHAHALRDELGADLVSLVYDGAGVAQLRGAFSVSAGAPYVFAHEIGHNLGLLHDRHESQFGLHWLEFGFVPPRGSSFCFSTIMAGWNRCLTGWGVNLQRSEFPFYSSPWRYHPVDGRPLGVSRFSQGTGLDGPANAVLTMSRVAKEIANYRAPVSTAKTPVPRVARPSASKSGETPVDIPDVGLRRRLEQVLKKGQDEVITRGDMESLRELVWEHETKSLRSLAGLEYAVNLESLWVTDGLVSDLSPLSDLASLRHLTVWNHEVSDLGPLSGLQRLTYLSVGGNRVSNLAPLTNLTALTDLNLTNNAVVNIRPLAKINSLRHLTLKWNGIADIAPLLDNAGVGEGDTVILTENPLNHHSREAHIPALQARGVLVTHDWSDPDEEIDIPGEIADPALGEAIRGSLYSPRRPITLDDLAALDVLDGVSLGIEKLSGLQFAVALRQLDLSDNAISDLGPLGELGTLRNVYLDSLLSH